MKKTKRLGLVLIVALLAMSAAGCLLFAGAAAGAGTYAYVSGNLKTTYDATLPRAWEATDRALEQLNMVVEEEKKDAFSGKFSGEMVDGRAYTVSLTRVTDATTEIAVRVGLGDRDVSESIHAEIAAILER